MDHQEIDLCAARDARLRDIAWYFLRAYDPEIYDGSMRSLVASLDAIESELHEARRTT